VDTKKKKTLSLSLSLSLSLRSTPRLLGEAMQGEGKVQTGGVLQDGVPHGGEAVEVGLPKQLVQHRGVVGKVAHTSQPVQNVAKVGRVAVDEKLGLVGRRRPNEAFEEGVGAEEGLLAGHEAHPSDVEEGVHLLPFLSLSLSQQRVWGL
jgi:hypothetical protein